MLLALTPGERLRMSFEMYELAGKLARAGILLKKPDATEVEDPTGDLLRFYKAGLHRASARSHSGADREAIRAVGGCVKDA